MWALHKFSFLGISQRETVYLRDKHCVWPRQIQIKGNEKITWWSPVCSQVGEDPSSCVVLSEGVFPSTLVYCPALLKLKWQEPAHFTKWSGHHQVSEWLPDARALAFLKWKTPELPECPSPTHPPALSLRYPSHILEAKAAEELICQEFVNSWCWFGFGFVFILWCWKWNSGACTCLTSTLYLGPAFISVNLRHMALICGMSRAKEIFVIQSPEQGKAKTVRKPWGLSAHS